MKTLSLVRHAKASKGDATLSDRARPLTDRGKRDVAKMGKRLAKRAVMPDLILSSPAIRALATAEVIAEKLDFRDKTIVVNDRLYACQADDLLDVIQEFDDTLKHVMLVGHNPELAELVHRLSSKITHLPTCAIVKFDFDTKLWSDIGKTEPAKIVFDYPKKT